MKIMFFLYPEWKYMWGQIRKVLSSPIFVANTPDTKETQIFARSKQVIHIYVGQPLNSNIQTYNYTNIQVRKCKRTRRPRYLLEANKWYIYIGQPLNSNIQIYSFTNKQLYKFANTKEQEDPDICLKQTSDIYM